MRTSLVTAVIALVGLLSSAGELLARTPVVTAARITWYGIVTEEKEVITKSSRSSTGDIRTVRGIVPPATNTDTIPLADNVNFGFGYELVGHSANATATLKYVYIWPAPGIPVDGKLLLSKEVQIDLRVGRKDLFITGGPLLKSHPAGKWTLQIWYGDRLLAEKSFNVTEQ